MENPIGNKNKVRKCLKIKIKKKAKKRRKKKPKQIWMNFLNLG
jgi:hypothetical protein